MRRKRLDDSPGYGASVKLEEITKLALGAIKRVQVP